MKKNIIMLISILFLVVILLIIIAGFWRANRLLPKIETIYELSKDKTELDIEAARKEMKKLENDPLEILNSSNNLSFKKRIQYLKLVQKLYPKLEDTSKPDFAPISVAASAQMTIAQTIFEILKSKEIRISTEEAKNRYYPILFHELDIIKDKHKNDYVRAGLALEDYRYMMIGKAGSLALYMKAEALLVIGEKEKMITTMEEIITNYPDSHEIYYEGGGSTDDRAYTRLREIILEKDLQGKKIEPGKEMKFLDTIIPFAKSRKLLSGLLFRKAEIYVELRDYDEAIEIYRKLMNEFKEKIEPSYVGSSQYVPVSAFVKAMNICISKSLEEKGKKLLKDISERNKDDELLLKAFLAYEKEYGSGKRIQRVLDRENSSLISSFSLEQKNIGDIPQNNKVSNSGKWLVKFEHAFPPGEAVLYNNGKLTKCLTIESNILDVAINKGENRLLILSDLEEYAEDQDSRIDDMPAYIYVFNLNDFSLMDKYLVGHSPEFIDCGKESNQYLLFNNNTVYIMEIN